MDLEPLLPGYLVHSSAPKHFTSLQEVLKSHHCSQLEISLLFPETLLKEMEVPLVHLKPLTKQLVPLPYILSPPQVKHLSSTPDITGLPQCLQHI